MMRSRLSPSDEGAGAAYSSPVRASRAVRAGQCDEVGNRSEAHRANGGIRLAQARARVDCAGASSSICRPRPPDPVARSRAASGGRSDWPIRNRTATWSPGGNSAEGEVLLPQGVLQPVETPTSPAKPGDGADSDPHCGSDARGDADTAAE